MKTKFLSLFAAILFTGSMMAEGLLFEQTYPGNPSEYVAAYTKSFTIMTGDHTLTYTNINNGNDGDSPHWDILRAGRKNNNASIATITSGAIAETVSKVIIDFTQVDANLTNKLALLVADNAQFTGATEIVKTIAVGEVAFVIAAPAQNMYYRISIDMQASSDANGFNRFDKIQFISPNGGTQINPEVYDTLTVTEAKALCNTLANNASSETKYYVVGYAINVQPYSAQYSNQIFFMADLTIATDTEFEAYCAVPMKNGQVYPVLAGDKVRVFGKLKKYVKDGVAQLEIMNPTVEFLEEVVRNPSSPDDPTQSEDKSKGQFSVSANKKVCFSPGNVQYKASTNTWRFAEHQYDFVGDATQGNVFVGEEKSNNANISTEYSGWIDLFGFSTSTNYFGVSNSNSNSDYAGTFVDWGENYEGDWRTLGKDEWYYLIKQRTNANNLYGAASVCGVHGLIILPDNWEMPSNLVWQSGANNFTTNQYDTIQWMQMGNRGAVFLPIAGMRDRTNVLAVGGTANYWSSTEYNANDAYYFNFNASLFYPQYYDDRYGGRSVRLVRDAVPYTIRWHNYDGILLEKDENVEFGSMPIYNGEIPTRPATEEYTYTFKGWSPEVVAVTSDAVYTAEYDSIAIVKVGGEFSVSVDIKVCFSPGNLQYQASTNTWRFAEHQWDYVGDGTQGTVYANNVKCDNSLISDTYSGWIDLFGYSTASTYFGVNTSTNANDYSGEFVDWGINIGEGWRTLTKAEWTYILNERPSAQNLYFCAIVNGVCGAIILPDDGMDIEYNDIITPNNCTLERWNILEARGAVFLPAAGYRGGTSTGHVQTNGDYYAATDKATGSFVDGLEFECSNKSVHVDDMNFRYDGRSVRLVKDVNATPTPINNVYGVSTPTKLLQNGQILILRGEKVYTLTGQEVR